jgi:hypothetical protein
MASEWEINKAAYAPSPSPNPNMNSSLGPPKQWQGWELEDRRDKIIVMFKDDLEAAREITEILNLRRTFNRDETYTLRSKKPGKLWKM